MTKDLSRRSSAEGLGHQSPRGGGVESPQVKSQHLSEPSSNTSRPVLSIEDANKPMPDTDFAGARAAESQPMTASNSTSSNPSAVELGTGTAAPYGTRSRNRAGTSRPNYAEDKELDADFEVAAPAKDGRKPNRGADLGSATNADTGRAANTPRKNPGSEVDQPVAPQNHKEPIPGTSSFSANPATTGSSKKRKAASQPSTAISLQSQLQALPLDVPITQAITRRASMAAQGGLCDSNMLSFENCGGGLKDNRLVADDETVLEVNGELRI